MAEVIKIRNVSIVGNGGTGKTSLSDAILYDAGAVDRLGKVNNGSSIMDYDADEISRQTTINLSLGYCNWNKYKINILDTPGNANFFSDTEGSLRVVDGLVVVVSATDGVGVQTEKIWNKANELNLPRIVFLNKIDQERADFFGNIENLSKSFNQNIVPLQIPVNQGVNFNGIIDLIKMKVLKFDGVSNKVSEEEIPKELLEKANEQREKLIEASAEINDKLLEKYLEGEELDDTEIKKSLREGIINGKIVPVVCGCVIKNMGVQPLLDLIVECLPSPNERPEIKGTDPKNNEVVSKNPSEQEPFSAFVFKTITDPYAGKLNFFRVFSGQLTSDSTVLNSTKKTQERIGQIYAMLGKNQKPVSSISAGDFAAVAKLKTTVTGDTFCDEKKPIIFEPIKFPDSVISFAIVPKSKGDEEKVSTALTKLKEEDPTLKVERDSQTKELTISGMGQIHLEVIVEKLKRKFGVEVNMKTPKVPYKETIRKSCKVQGKYKKQSGGRGQYGDTRIEIEPLPRGKGFEFVNKIVGGVIPRQYVPAVEKGIVEAMGQGALAGYTVVDVKVTLYDGSFHSVDSSEMAFKIAGSLAFKKGVLQANPVLLEPIMNIEVVVPEEYMGDIIGDLNSKRGKISGVDSMNSNQKIKAQVPMAEILSYSSNLTSMTGGRGAFTMEFSHYEEVPGHISEVIIKEKGEKKEEK
ncbi:MAG TPA: elongation factor G [Nitrospinota bacterium]|nr:elongation factor G [Nitrospinota bacterium]